MTQRHLINLAQLSRENLITKGGFTISPRPDHPVPTSGYLASAENTERKFDSIPTTGDILNYFQKTPLPLGWYFGGWEHEGSFYLDTSVHFCHLWDALRYAREQNQISIFDLDFGRVIFIDEPEKRGHVGTSGLQSHSFGDIYPWSIVGVGDTLQAWQLVSGERRERFDYTPGDTESFYTAYALAEQSIDECVVS